MGLIPWRVFLIAVAIIIGLLFVTGAIGTFGLHWQKSPKKCTENYHYEYGEWKSLVRVSHIELRYKPANRVCQGFEYDPAEGWQSLYEAKPQPTP